MPPRDPRSDEELLHDREDPAETFAVFYRRHVDAVLRFAAARGADADHAADVASETFVAALRQRHAYSAHHDDARLWLLGIAARKLIDGHRQAQGDRHRTEALARTIALTRRDRDGYARLLADEAARDYLADLPEQQRRLVHERVVADRSYADIARDLGLSEQSVRKQVSRGLARLRTQMGKNR
ncbi:sigma-70 family RNA polymerase sigma factor [Patulibacter sp. SYSU D01012]|uniref:RNA polymerase sigma factor n=1 Tax=Patulibacter sp. SYSU D01012 TaxID=2817381 RepID=UPI001B30BC21